jgi:hypothetical protein
MPEDRESTLPIVVTFAKRPCAHARPQGQKHQEKHPTISQKGQVGAARLSVREHVSTHDPGLSARSVIRRFPEWTVFKIHDWEEPMFKVQDLMIDVLSVGNGGGDIMPTPTEPTPPPTISPIAVVAAYSPRFEAIDRVVMAGASIGLDILDKIALDVGRAVVGARAAALCTEDMATCQNNERISPFASTGLGELRAADFGVLQDHIRETVQWLDERGDLLEKRAIESKTDLLPRLERAVEYLKSQK